MVANQETNKILIIDNDSDVCIILKEVLEESGFAAHYFDDPVLAPASSIILRLGYMSCCSWTSKCQKSMAFDCTRKSKRWIIKSRSVFLQQVILIKRKLVVHRNTSPDKVYFIMGQY